MLLLSKRKIHTIIRRLQRTYSAGETGVMQELDKHNLTGITGPYADFLTQFRRNLVQTFFVECTFDRLGRFAKF